MRILSSILPELASDFSADHPKFNFNKKSLKFSPDSKMKR